MKIKYPETIKEAAEALDIIDNKWFKKINAHEIAMAGFKKCILGQIFGEYDIGLSKFEGMYRQDALQDKVFGSRANPEDWKVEIGTRYLKEVIPSLNIKISNYPSSNYCCLDVLSSCKFYLTTNGQVIDCFVYPTNKRDKLYYTSKTEFEKILRQTLINIAEIKTVSIYEENTVEVTKEEKTSGLTFAEIIPYLAAGKKIRRATWGKKDFIYRKYNNNCTVVNENDCIVNTNQFDIFASNWEVVQEPVIKKFSELKVGESFKYGLHSMKKVQIEGGFSFNAIEIGSAVGKIYTDEISPNTFVEVIS